jgi:hypothetical protein
MDATTVTRTIRCSRMLLLAVLALGALTALTAQEAGAEPNNGTKPPSISYRVNSFTEMCELIGKGTASVSYSYEGGKLVGAHSSCKGGSEDGRNCTYTENSSNCYRVPKRSERVTTTTGEIVSMEAAPSDAGAGDGTGTETTVGSTAAATESAIPVIEAEPATIQLVEDDQE